VDPLGEEVGIDRANPSGTIPAEGTEVIIAPLYQLIVGCWIRGSTVLEYPGMHDKHHS
jgi:hypothetical protein